MTQDEAAELIELRVRLDRPAQWVFKDRTREEMPVVDAKEMDALLAALSGYALYACERQMAQGYIPLPGGHRAGVCGRIVREDGQSARMSAVSSVCLRVARHVRDASGAIRPVLLDGLGRCRRVLLLGPPGCGKTTVLRDAALWLSDAQALHVAVADERQELFACLPSGQGKRIDVLSGAEKSEAVRLFLRSMAPDAIVTDEIGQPQDVDALLDAVRCGVGVLASAHAGSMEDALARPVLRALFDAHAFDRYVLLGRQASLVDIWDAQGGPLNRALKGGTAWPVGMSP